MKVKKNELLKIVRNIKIFFKYKNFDPLTGQDL